MPLPTQNYDIAFAWNENYVTNAKNGSFLELGSYLSDNGQALFNAIDSRFWDGVTVNGGIYGVPTNKELATPIQFLFSQSLIDKYGFDVSACTTLESLEPMLEVIAANEPDCIPLFFDSSQIDILSIYGYTYLAGDSLPLVMRSDDPTCQILSLYDTPEAEHLFSTLHRYYQAGYINADASLRTSFSRYSDEQVFCRLASGGPDSSTSFSVDFGYPILAIQASLPVVTSASAQGGIMVVNAQTEHPAEALAFLNAVNTDPDVRNLLNYGIEGVHYQLTTDDQVSIISQNYRGVPYTQGNWFILKTAVGERLDKWDVYRAFNESAVTSPLLGFTLDDTTCQTAYHAVSRVYKKYRIPLLTGTVDPEIYLPQLRYELQKAGIALLSEKLQTQINAFLAQKNSP